MVAPVERKDLLHVAVQSWSCSLSVSWNAFKDLQFSDSVDMPSTLCSYNCPSCSLNVQLDSSFRLPRYFACMQRRRQGLKVGGGQNRTGQGVPFFRFPFSRLFSL